MSAIYKLNKVTKNYGKITALDDLTLELGEGPIAVLGYSGAGKTTLLKLLAGLETASAGTIKFRNKTIINENIRGLRRAVTMVFQEQVFFNNTVLENVTYGLRIRGVDKEEAFRKAGKYLDALGLHGFENRKTMKLSGGEKQRVALARALVLQPEALLLDEPTSNLDPANATVIARTIRDFAQRGLVIIATHNFLDVRRLTKSAIYLEKGRVVESGSTQEVLNTPKSEGAKRFAKGLFSE